MNNMKSILSEKDIITCLKNADSGLQNKFDKIKSKRITKKSVGLFACLQCDYTSNNKTNVIRHMQSVHEGVQFDCDMCEYKATHLSSLWRHKKREHEGKKYDCKCCDFQATSLQISPKYPNPESPWFQYHIHWYKICFI